MSRAKSKQAKDLLLKLNYKAAKKLPEPVCGNALLHVERFWKRTVPNSELTAEEKGMRKVLVAAINHSCYRDYEIRERVNLLTEYDNLAVLKAFFRDITDVQVARVVPDFGFRGCVLDRDLRDTWMFPPVVPGIFRDF